MLRVKMEQGVLGGNGLYILFQFHPGAEPGQFGFAGHRPLDTSSFAGTHLDKTAGQIAGQQVLA